MKSWEDAPTTMIDCISRLQIFPIEGVEELGIELDRTSIVLSDALVNLALFV